MRIAFYISSLSGGGAEKVLTTIANRFSEEGNDVHVISLEKRPQFYSVNSCVHLHKIENKSKVFFKCTFKDISFIKKCFTEINADISISFLSRCNILVLLSNLFNKEKIIVCDRNNPLKEHSRFVFLISNLIYKRANLILVQTKQIKKMYHSSLQRKIEVQENPLDTFSLYNQLPCEDIKKDNTIISIGRLEPQKDYVTLIKAFAKISPRYPDWTLKIFGIGKDLDSLFQLTKSLRLEGKVNFCGRTKKPFYELKKSKIFVLSSRYEGFPNVLCEAMEAGLPCIASNCVSGPNELIQNGINGYLFEIGDVDTLSLLLEQCIITDSELAGIAAHNSVQRLHLDENMKGWRSILKQVCEV